MKGYTFKHYDKEHMARATGTALPISFKQSVEVCSFIKNKSISNAKKMLQNVIEERTAVPFRRYLSDLSHKKETGPGRYPKNTSIEFIKLIESAEANAQFKGLNTSNLVIAHVSAHKAAKSLHYGRKSGRQMKRTNVEIVVEEKAKKSDDKKTRKISSKTPKKV